MKVDAAGIFIMRKDGKVLICHPTGHSPTLWSIPKGKVEEEEGRIDAALRETFEETNLDFRGNSDALFHIHCLESINYKHKKKILHPFLFLEKAESNIDWTKADIKCNSNVPEERGGFPEMDEYRWATLEEAHQLLHNTQVACINKIVEIISKR